MATYIRKLKDASGNYVSPAVRSTGVYLENNSTLSLLTFYPVGSIYQSFNDTSPASLFGGEWEKVENTFLYGSGTKGVGIRGGEENHVLTIYEIASHTHKPTTSDGRYVIADSSGPGAIPAPVEVPGRVINVSWEQWETSYTGGNQPHNNMPPYIVCNIWKRLA